MTLSYLSMKRIGSSITPYWTAYFLAVQVSLAGCASYQGRPVPIPVPEIMPYAYSDNSLEIYADPYLQLERQIEYFDADLTKLGVIPIQLLIRNKSDRSFELHYPAISLELVDGTHVPRSPLNDFMRAKDLPKKDRGEEVTAEEPEPRRNRVWRQNWAKQL